ncbi:MAG: hypothetical protein Q9159_006412 [Coniocarpon cinnabarinum]
MTATWRQCGRNNITHQYHLQLSSRSRKSASRSASRSRTPNKEHPTKNPVTEQESSAVSEIIADLKHPFQGEPSDDPCFRPDETNDIDKVAAQRRDGHARGTEDKELKQLLQDYQDRAGKTKNGWEGWLRREQEKKGTLPRQSAAAERSSQIPKSKSSPTASTLATSTTQVAQRRASSKDAQTPRSLNEPTAVAAGALNPSSRSNVDSQKPVASTSHTSVAVDPRKRKNPFGEGSKVTQAQQQGSNPSTAAAGSAASIVQRKKSFDEPEEGQVNEDLPIWAQRRRPSLSVDTNRRASNDASTTGPTSGPIRSASSTGANPIPISAGSNPERLKLSKPPGWAKKRAEPSSATPTASPDISRASGQSRSTSGNTVSRSSAASMQSQPAQRTASATASSTSAQVPGAGTGASSVDASRDPRKRSRSQFHDVYSRRG